MLRFHDVHFCYVGRNLVSRSHTTLGQLQLLRDQVRRNGLALSTSATSAQAAMRQLQQEITRIGEMIAGASASMLDFATDMQSLRARPP